MASTVVIQLLQISYYVPFNHCAGPIWVQNKNPWSKLSLWWRSGLVYFKKQKFGATMWFPEGLENTPFKQNQKQKEMLYLSNWNIRNHQSMAIKKIKSDKEKWQFCWDYLSLTFSEKILFIGLRKKDKLIKFVSFSSF